MIFSDYITFYDTHFLWRVQPVSLTTHSETSSELPAHPREECLAAQLRCLHPATPMANPLLPCRFLAHIQPWCEFLCGSWASTTMSLLSSSIDSPPANWTLLDYEIHSQSRPCSSFHMINQIQSSMPPTYQTSQVHPSFTVDRMAFLNPLPNSGSAFDTSWFDSKSIQA
jgi:hypothetical protein